MKGYDRRGGILKRVKLVNEYEQDPQMKAWGDSLKELSDDYIQQMKEVVSCEWRKYFVIKEYNRRFKKCQ